MFAFVFHCVNKHIKLMNSFSLTFYQRPDRKMRDHWGSQNGFLTTTTTPSPLFASNLWCLFLLFLSVSPPPWAMAVFEEAEVSRITYLKHAHIGNMCQLSGLWILRDTGPTVGNLDLAALLHSLSDVKHVSFLKKKNPKSTACLVAYLSCDDVSKCHSERETKTKTKTKEE